MIGLRDLLDWLRGRRRVPASGRLRRVHPDDLRAEQIEREQERIVARLDALRVPVDLDARLRREMREAEENLRRRGAR